MNKTKLTSILLSLLAILIVLPITVNAEYDGSEGDGGEGGAVTGSTYDASNQGLRFYVIDKQGAIVSNVVDITATDPTEDLTANSDYRIDTKRGNPSKKYIPHYGKYSDYFPKIGDVKMPNPVSYNDSSHAVVPHGDEIKVYFMTDSGNGVTVLTDFLNNKGSDAGNILGLDVSSGEHPYDIIKANGYIVMIEYPNISSWVYGSYMNIAQFMTDKGYGDRSYSAYSEIFNEVGHVSLIIEDDLDFGNGDIITAPLV